VSDPPDVSGVKLMTKGRELLFKDGTSRSYFDGSGGHYCVTGREEEWDCLVLDHTKRVTESSDGSFSHLSLA
jgi:hypothetical protein